VSLAEESSLFGFDSEAWLANARGAESAPELGHLGPYELLAEAGRGGQGVVFRARQPGTGREIALKRLLAGSFASATARRRFEREVEAVTALNHPGIVTVYGVDVAEGSPLLAMDWIEGEPVTAWAAGRAREEVLALFLSVCNAVQHAHQRGVLHRDLKPSNVVVDPSGRPRVLDFGLAKLASDPGASVSKSGEFVGTPAYAAPEQWRGEEIDARADVYSLGALLFEMLTGRRAVEGEGIRALAQAELRSVPRPSSLVRSIPRELDAIVLQALASEREARYQSVDALSGDVRRYLAGQAVLAHPPEPGTSSRSSSRATASRRRSPRADPRHARSMAGWPPAGGAARAGARQGPWRRRRPSDSRAARRTHRRAGPKRRSRRRRTRKRAPRRRSPRPRPSAGTRRRSATRPRPRSTS
jgi:serine/threonine protein kinase